MGFLWVLEFICRKWRNISTAENGVWSLTLQKSVENFTAQQKLKKSQFHDRSWSNVPSAIEMENKSSLQRCPLYFELNVCAQTDSGKIGPQSPLHESIRPNFLSRKKHRQNFCLITSKHMSKIQRSQKNDPQQRTNNMMLSNFFMHSISLISLNRQYIIQTTCFSIFFLHFDLLRFYSHS